MGRMRCEFINPNIVIPNLFRDNTLLLLVILKQVQDDEGPVWDDEGVQDDEGGRMTSDYFGIAP